MKKKLGIIDIFIVLAFVIIAVFVFKKYGQKSAVVESTRPVSITLTYGQVPKDVADNLKLEGTIIDEQRKISLGEIKDLKIEDGYVFTLSDNKNILKNKDEHFKTVYITTQTEAVVYNNGIIISGSKYEVGHPFKIIANGNLLSCKIMMIEEN